MSSSETQHDYRVTIRHYRDAQRYEIQQIRAADLREALACALARFPDELRESSDLIEIRLASLAEGGGR